MYIKSIREFKLEFRQKTRVSLFCQAIFLYRLLEIIFFENYSKIKLNEFEWFYLKKQLT